MAYVPKPAPTDPAQFQAWVLDEMQSLAREWQQSQSFLLLDTLYAEPKRLIEGLTVKADGTSWNPGSGAGIYTYRAGAWVLLG